LLSSANSIPTAAVFVYIKRLKEKKLKNFFVILKIFLFCALTLPATHSYQKCHPYGVTPLALLRRGAGGEVVFRRHCVPAPQSVSTKSHSVLDTESIYA